LPHGLPRCTGDLDAWVWVSAENATRVVRTLEAFGFSNLGPSEKDFNQLDQVVQLGYPPYRIDILTSIEGVEFNNAWGRRVILELDGIDVPFIVRDDLLTNQGVARRPPRRCRRRTTDWARVRRVLGGRLGDWAVKVQRSSMP
jgi:hypothetical protein